MLVPAVIFRSPRLALEAGAAREVSAILSRVVKSMLEHCPLPTAK
jgi:hypothetical protein